MITAKADGKVGFMNVDHFHAEYKFLQFLLFIENMQT